MSDEERQEPAPEPKDAAQADEAERAERLKEAAAAKAKVEAAMKAKAAREAAEAAKEPWERDPAAPTAEDAIDDALTEALRSAHGEKLLAATKTGDELAFTVEREAVREVCATLCDEHGYKLFVDLCGVDYPQREEARFEIVYHAFSLETHRRVRVKVSVPEGEEVPSVRSVWRGADWCEREVYDMYGVRFSDHPDMTRILLWEGFNGHPLRKDFPVEGIDTGAAIYPERYDSEAGPIAGTGTGWKVPEPPQEEEAEEGTEESDS